MKWDPNEKRKSKYHGDNHYGEIRTSGDSLPLAYFIFALLDLHIGRVPWHLADSKGLSSFLTQEVLYGVKNASQVSLKSPSPQKTLLWGHCLDVLCADTHSEGPQQVGMVSLVACPS